MGNRQNVLIFFLIFLKLNHGLIESEYECVYNLYSKLFNVSLKYKANSTNKYEFCGDNNDGGFWVNCWDDYVVGCNLVHKNSRVIFSISDFNCFSSIKIIQSYYRYKFEKNFLYGLSATTLNFFTSFYSDESLIDLDLSENKTIQITSIIIKELIIKKNLNIYFSSLKSVFIFQLESIPSNYQINYINDLTDIKNITKIIINSNNIPSMNNIHVENMEINLLPNFNIESFSNFSTYANVNDLKLNASKTTDIFPFPLSLCDLPFNTLESLKIHYQIEKPLDFINLSKLNKLFSIKIPNAGILFNVDGEFPFYGFQTSEFPLKIKFFEFSNGRINNLNLNLDTMNIEILTMENNDMFGIIPTTFKNGKTLFLKGNRFVGEIDESWCGKRFDISNNNIGGELPSCMKCHYLDPIAISNLSGNKFKNINPNNLEPCLEIDLNLWFNDSSETLILQGKNLGSFPFSIVLNDPLIHEEIEACKEYIIRKSLYKPGITPMAINLTFPFLPQGPLTLEISAYNQFLPEINRITKYSDYFIIIGKYFAYNESVINVLMSNQSCLIIKSNFNEIQCYLLNPNQIMNINETISVVVQVMNVSNSFNFTVNQACDGDNCPIADCGKYGEYNFESGVCECFSNEWRGYSCELKSLICQSEDCSGNGNCNHIIGQCECDKNRIFNDCSGILCNDGNGCFNDGECNFQNGICNCSSKWVDSSGCITPKQVVESQELKHNEFGNLLTLFGWFGDIHQNLLILVDGIYCDIVSNDNQTIQCYPPDFNCNFIKISSLSLSISQNNFKWKGIYNPIFIDGCNTSNSDSENISNNNDESSSLSHKLSNSNLAIVLSICITLAIFVLLGIIFYFKQITKKKNKRKFIFDCGEDEAFNIPRKMRLINFEKHSLFLLFL